MYVKFILIHWKIHWFFEGKVLSQSTLKTCVRIFTSCSRPLDHTVVHSDIALGVVHGADRCVVVVRLFRNFELRIHSHLETGRGNCRIFSIVCIRLQQFSELYFMQHLLCILFYYSSFLESWEGYIKAIVWRWTFFFQCNHMGYVIIS